MHRVNPPAGAWRHQAYGSITDPIHKSHMSYWVGQFACAQQFLRVRNDPEGHLRESGMKASLGTAGHEVVAMILSGYWPGVLRDER